MWLACVDGLLLSLSVPWACAERVCGNVCLIPPAVPVQATTFSYGIWKSVYTVAVPAAAVTYLVPLVLYTGNTTQFPTQRMTPGAHAPFEVLGACGRGVVW